MFTFQMYRIVSLMYHHHPSFPSHKPILTITILALITSPVISHIDVEISPRTFLLIPFPMFRSENVYLCKLMSASSGENSKPNIHHFPKGHTDQILGFILILSEIIQIMKSGSAQSVRDIFCPGLVTQIEKYVIIFSRNFPPQQLIRLSALFYNFMQILDNFRKKK